MKYRIFALPITAILTWVSIPTHHAAAAVAYVDSGVIIAATTSIDVVCSVSGTNKVLYAFVTRDATSDVNPSAVWDSAGANQSMTLVQESGSGTSRYLAMFRLIAPTDGTAKNVTISGLTAIDNVGTCISLEGVNQATPDDTAVADANTTGTSDSNTVSSTTGDLVVSVITVNNQNTAGLVGDGAGGTEREASGNGGIGMGLMTEPGAASVDADWSWSSNSDWRHWAFNVKAASSTTTPNFMLLGVGP